MTCKPYILPSAESIKSKSGTIDRSEFFQSVEESDSELGKVIFAFIDQDNNGTLDFEEYVDALRQFCILGKEDLLKFCFNVFDEARNGTMKGQELAHLADLMHENATEARYFKEKLKVLRLRRDGCLDFTEFKRLNDAFPGLLYPLFRIQNNMKLYTMGERWWQRKIQQLQMEGHEGSTVPKAEQKAVSSCMCCWMSKNSSGVVPGDTN